MASEATALDEGMLREPANRAAVLLMSLGEKDAANILKYMGPKEVQRVGTAMSSIANVSRQDVELVFGDFINNFNTQSGLGLGTEDYIRNMLVEALGEDKAGGILDRILVDGNTSGIDSLKWMDPRSVATAIQNEHPQIQAVVLSYLDADRSANILMNFPEKVRLDIVMRIATLESVQPDALKELNAILEKQFSGGGANPATDIGGLKTAAEIMNNLDRSVETELLESLKELDEEMGDQIQDLMFIFDNLKEVDDRGIQALLREISSDLLILSLKAADEELQEKIFGNMSKRAAELLRDDLEAKGPVKISDVEAAQKEILATARRMAEAGDIQLGSSGEQMV
ncbi:MAG: flagellar motor switch protein FliG [Pseudomonadales bacterium]|nr:flagellar motor switch protein FliG [Pseudomonadales bacterium]